MTLLRISELAGRIAELRAKIAEDTTFELQMERILARLTSGAPTPERGGADCGCDCDPLDVASAPTGLAGGFFDLLVAPSRV